MTRPAGRRGFGAAARASALAAGAAGLVAGAAASGCARRVPAWRVPDRGEPLTADALAGAWSGTYAAGRYRRAGPLRLELARGAGGALGGAATLGNVPAARRGDAYALTAAERRAAAAERLAVDSARVAGREVTLWLRPYWDRGCDCTVTLTLRGALRADTLAGAFVGSAAATVPAERDGRWLVVRARP